MKHWWRSDVLCVCVWLSGSCCCLQDVEVREIKKMLAAATKDITNLQKKINAMVRSLYTSTGVAGSNGMCVILLGTASMTHHCVWCG